MTPARPNPSSPAFSMAFRYALLIATAFVAALPFMWALAASVKPLDEVYAYPPRWTTSDWQWSN